MKPQKFYFDGSGESDDEPFALSAETCHPSYNHIIQYEFYRDVMDEFSPFGNDDGADALLTLEDWYRETEGRENIVAFMEEFIDGFGYDYQFADYATVLDEDVIAEIEDENPRFLTTMDQTIIGTAFGQYKISGAIHPELKKLGLIAIERQEIISRMHIEAGDIDLSKLAKIVDMKTTLPGAEGNTNHLQAAYLDRLAIMKADLKKFK